MRFLLICCALIFVPEFGYSQWLQKGLDLDGEAAGDLSGRSVSISADGHTVAIGADLNDGLGEDAGHVRVYEWDNSLWQQKGLDIDGIAEGDNCGWSVSLSADGNTLAEGSLRNDGNGVSSGQVRIFDWNGTQWIQRGMSIYGLEFEQIGRSVELAADGNTVGIGASDGYGNGAGSGVVRIYEWNGTTWSQKGEDINGEATGDFSGGAISMNSNANTIAIGAISNDGDGLNRGHVRVFDWNGTLWFQRGQDLEGQVDSDFFGRSVSLNAEGNILAIGADGHDTNGESSGQVIVYQWVGNGWFQLGDEIHGEEEEDHSGISLDLSSTGLVLAIGSNKNQWNGNNSGHVRLFEFTGLVWASIEDPILGESSGDFSGTSLALSESGSTVAIGAIRNLDAGIESGHVRVYSNADLSSLDKLDFDIPLMLSPNPNSGVYSVDLGKSYPEITVSLEDLNGREVQRMIFFDRKILKLETKEPSGMYLLRIQSEDQQAVMKLLIE